MSVLFRMREQTDYNQKTCDADQQSAPVQDDSPVHPHTEYGLKRASRWALPGNLTAEAAIVLPLFLYAIINLLSLILMFRDFSEEEARLHQLGRSLSLLAHGRETDEPDVRLMKVTRESAPIPIVSFPSAAIVNGCVMHKWIGYDLQKEGIERGPDGEELVYVTRSGRAYHRDRSCIYLNPSVRMLPREQAEGAQNTEGRRYTACEICGGGSAMVYVTDYGQRYHSTITCGGLKRTIDGIPLSEAIASGRHACPRCST